MSLVLIESFKVGAEAERQVDVQFCESMLRPDMLESMVRIVG